MPRLPETAQERQYVSGPTRRTFRAVQGWTHPLTRFADYIFEFLEIALVRSTVAHGCATQPWMPEGVHGFRCSICNPSRSRSSKPA